MHLLFPSFWQVRPWKPFNRFTFKEQHICNGVCQQIVSVIVMVDVFFVVHCGSTISHKRYVTMLWCHRTGMIEYSQHLSCMSHGTHILLAVRTFRFRCMPHVVSHQTYPTERTFARHITLERPTSADVREVFAVNKARQYIGVLHLKSICAYFVAVCLLTCCTRGKSTG